MNNYDLSIIILNYKTANLIKYCIYNLKKINPLLKYEIIVVDNDSADNCEQIVKKHFIEVKFIQAKNNRGYAAGNNLGIKKAQGKYILIVNPDIAFLDKTLEKMYDFMGKNPKIGIIGPKLLNADGTLQYSCGNFPDWHLPFYRRTILSKTNSGQKWLKNYLMKDWNHNENREVDWLFGACLLIRKEAIEEVGLLDERFFLYLEDTDWCRRFWENGYQVIYFAAAEVIHYHQRSSAENLGLTGLLSKAGRIHIISFIKYYFKYLGKENPHTTLYKI